MKHPQLRSRSSKISSAVSAERRLSAFLFLMTFHLEHLQTDTQTATVASALTVQCRQQSKWLTGEIVIRDHDRFDYVTQRVTL
jgi:hypothetical protein